MTRRTHTYFSAAFGTHNLTTISPELQRRCNKIAKLCRDLIHDGQTKAEELEQQTNLGTTLLDHVDENLHAILSIPAEIRGEKDKELVALPSNKVPLLFRVR